MAVSEFIVLATAMPSIPVFDAYLWVAARLGHRHYIFSWLKLRTGLWGAVS